MRRKFARDELCRQVNKEVNDKRLSINKQQLAYVVKKQTDYDYDTTRKQYNFRGKDNEPN